MGFSTQAVEQVALLDASGPDKPPKPRADQSGLSGNLVIPIYSVVVIV